MSDAIIVPIQLDALVVNNAVQARDNFRTWPFNYQALGTFKSPVPNAFDANTGSTLPGVYLHWNLPRALRSGTQDPVTKLNTYLAAPNRWLVVRSSGPTSARVQTAWVIESDCPFTTALASAAPINQTQYMSMYLVDADILAAWKASTDTLRNTFPPNPSGPSTANLGARFLLSAWSERDATSTFLTALAPGNSAFSIYYPHNMGIFSMYDDLSTVAAVDTLSYEVVGWYSNAAEDVMAGWKAGTSPDPCGDLLTHFGWSLAVKPGAPLQTTRSLYQGLALSLPWDLTGAAPAADPLPAITGPDLTVAIGNTPIDALSALIDTQLKANGHPDQTLPLLRAFQYDLLPVLNQVNGDALLDERIRQEWFGALPSGYRWRIAEESSDGDPAVDLTAAESVWLAQLNTDQESLDSALGALFQLQWRFNAAWWELGKNPDTVFFPNPPPKGISNAAFKIYLDPTTSSGITNALIAQFGVVNALLPKVPQPIPSAGSTPQQALEAGIAAFASVKGLSAGKVLKAVAAPRFYRANDPVVMVSGLVPAAATDAYEQLVVRRTGDLLTSFIVDAKPINAAMLGTALQPPAGLLNLPPECAALFTEFFLLDPANAQAIATATGLPLADVTTAMTTPANPAYTTPLPTLGLAAWAQPWEPMYLEWQVNYTDLPFGPDWIFDGSDHHYAPGANPSPADRGVGGIILLGPNAQETFGKRLSDFLNKYTDPDLQQLSDWIEQIDEWKFLSQELSGFNEQLILRDTRAFRRPGAEDTVGTSTVHSVADLAGFPNLDPAGATNIPAGYQGRVRSVPYFPNGQTWPSLGIRSGQLYFEQLAIYDKFGRRLWLIEPGSNSGLYDAQNFPMNVDAPLVPTTIANTSGVKAVAELAPRLLQHARLDLQIADSHQDTLLLETSPNVQPISGWVLPNHLDGSILLYAPDGTSLGEFRLFAQAAGGKLGQWVPPIHGTITQLSQVQQAAPHIYDLITAGALAQEDAFNAFLKTIDDALWTVDPLGDRSDQNLSVLIGRPLALVRVRAAIVLNGPPLGDTGWTNALTLNPAPASDFTAATFPVRFGDQATRDDGVIGYFVGTNYATFNSVVTPDASFTQTYVRSIGPLGQAAGNYVQLPCDPAKSATFLTLLVDPRAAVHAITGVFPRKRLDIPAAYVVPALRNLEVSFTLGPLLTAVQPTPSQGTVTPTYPNAIALPTPAEQNGTWAWWEQVAGQQPAAYDLVDTVPNAAFENAKHSLREGVLQLTIDPS